MAQAWENARRMKIGSGLLGNVQETESGEKVEEESAMSKGVYFTFHAARRSIARKRNLNG
jgi:hypothetical protein